MENVLNKVLKEDRNTVKDSLSMTNEARMIFEGIRTSRLQRVA